MKTKITLLDLDDYCKSERNLSFCYVSEDGDNRSECMRISMTMPPPKVFVNLRTVCFSDERGGKITVRGISGVYLLHDRITGMDGVQFDCRSGEAKMRFYFSILRENFRKNIVNS